MPSPVRVLVVDDDPSIRLLCRVNLELDGHAVHEAASLEEARAALGAGGADVVLLDVSLGGLDSTPLLQELGEREPRIPVALLTGSADEGLRDLGADAVIEKPFTLDDLRTTVERLAAAPR